MPFNPRNLSQSRHCKDAESFIQYSHLVEASTFRKMQVNRHNQKSLSFKGNVHEFLLG